MMELAMKMFVFFVASSSCIFAQEKHDLKALLKQKGPPSFIASSAEIRGNFLICRDLDLFDSTDANAVEKLPGRVLLYCEPWDSLWFSVAKTALAMRKAAPLSGYEGPEAKFQDTKWGELECCKLLETIRVWMVYCDSEGIERLATQATVNKLAIRP